jgi:oxygen-dependent protoporphyrinogen oxidase
MLPGLPPVWQAFVQRWPNSLPQYEIGHQAAVARIEQLCSRLPGLHLLGNAYRGVGLSDMVHRAQLAASHALDV